MNARKELRLPVKCETIVTGHGLREEAVITDLSLGGCQVHCGRQVPAGTPLLLTVDLADQARPLEIELAQVQWSHGREFGLRNVIIDDANQSRLRRFLELRRLGADGSRLSGQPGPLAAEQARPMDEQVPFMSAPGDVSLGDVLLFLNWMTESQRSLDGGQVLPAPPELGGERLKACVRFVQTLEGRGQAVEQRHALVTKALDARQQEVSRLLVRLHDNLAAMYAEVGLKDKAEDLRRLASAIAAL